MCYKNFIPYLNFMHVYTYGSKGRDSLAAPNPGSGETVYKKFVTQTTINVTGPAKTGHVG